MDDSQRVQSVQVLLRVSPGLGRLAKWLMGIFSRHPIGYVARVLVEVVLLAVTFLVPLPKRRIDLPRR